MHYTLRWSHTQQQKPNDEKKTPNASPKTEPKSPAEPKRQERKKGIKEKIGSALINRINT